MIYFRSLQSIFLFLLFLSTGDAQTNTIFDVFNQEYKGFFGGRCIQIHHINDQKLTSGGGELGFGFSNILIGAYFSSTVVDFDVFIENATISQLHGGFLLGYTLHQKKLFHFLGKLKIGFGTASLLAGSPLSGESDIDVFMVAPEMGIEMNIYKHLKIGFLLSYQSVLNLNSKIQFDNSSLSGLGYGICLRFGIFDKGKGVNVEMKNKSWESN